MALAVVNPFVVHTDHVVFYVAVQLILRVGIVARDSNSLWEGSAIELCKSDTFEPREWQHRSENYF